MSRAIRFHQTGGPEVLTLEEVEVGEPGPGQARVRHQAIGVNFVDTYHRTGLYTLPLPAGLGVEGAGVVEAVGPGVAHVRAGDRVAYQGGPPGSYSERRVLPADRLVKLPDAVSFEDAAALMLKGLTVEMLVRRVHAVKPGETVLWHAAAGGVGLIACQWLKAIGARVIGTVGSDEKAALARAHGCDEVVVYTREDFPARVKALTGGAGVPVVYDSVGKATFDGSLDCLAPRGMMVSFGNASGPVPPVSPLTLGVKGSLFLTRPSVMAYTADRGELEQAAAALFALVAAKKIAAEIGRRYPLAEAAQAHRDLEGRRTTGSVLLLP
ncbi:quinone oxidoreductase family protein [Anaeromyxobacter paludicola]|uniref:Quinone oxidoreductase n=1 Tax=Anaeromyxobacter paludicola TaxID=2918171 RepID=A0ABN6NF89_9BACT|nr:quinone oxidoreductase [Anaeromyxobacter paludicola]BDG10859.1 quinone oxidoreductase [Anaeromyxobacter paludicola]